MPQEEVKRPGVFAARAVRVDGEINADGADQGLEVDTTTHRMAVAPSAKVRRVGIDGPGVIKRRSPQLSKDRVSRSGQR